MKRYRYVLLVGVTTFFTTMACATVMNFRLPGSATATHFSVGLLSAGAGDILYSGALSASRAISAGITPLFNPGALQGTVD